MNEQVSAIARPKLPHSEGFIVGIGASAGGLEALQLFFDHMPADSGLSFVIVQHLSPNYKSFMAELLAKHTSMEIFVAEHNMEVKPNSVYLIPPKKDMRIKDRVLQVTDHMPSTGLKLPIDMFLASLASDVGKLAVGVILSGTGSDGTRGVEAIKGHNGLVIVQDEISAKFDGMPNSARHTGIVDHVAEPSEMAKILLDYIVEFHEMHVEEDPDSGTLLNDSDEEIVQSIFGLLRQSSGIDFTYYKQNSIVRRIDRRMGLLSISSIQDYYQLLSGDPQELSALGKDLLIGVTEFFRDTQAFDIVAKSVLPVIFESKRQEKQIRVWVAGCSTGEEAYSLAILFQQYMEKLETPYQVKIFATDLDKDSIDFAGQGIYPEQSVRTISSRLLRDYFVKNGDMYQVSKEIRKMVVFAPHNITKDPPFSNLDLITCRNMLIYLQPEMQRKVLSLFHFALNPNGFMFLGPSETIGRLTNMFAPFDRKWNIFQQKNFQMNIASADLDMNDNLNVTRMNHLARRGYSQLKETQNLKKSDDLYAAFVDEHMPPCMVIDENNDVIHLSGNVNPYLVLARGKPSWNIYKMVEAHLAVAIVTAIQRVRKEKKVIHYKDIKANQGEQSSYLNLVVKPFTLRNKKFDKLVLVQFEEADRPISELPVKIVDSFDIENNVNQRIVELEQELQRAEESLQATIEELETSNEELQATNEELVAANEELMSTNEELQSVNEELVTVNTEYQFKIQELTDLNNDMDNFLVSTKIGTIFLDKDMCIRRFTPAITREINLLDVDYGRPIAHISHNFHYDGIVNDAKKVLKTLVPLEREIQSHSGNWYSMRVLPYRTSDNFIKGIVVTFVDITELKGANQELLKLSYAIEQSPSIIVIADVNGKVEYVNPMYSEITELSSTETVGRHVMELNYWDNSSVRFHDIWEIVTSGREWKGELESRRKNGQPYWEAVKLLPIKDKHGQVIHYLKIAEDITERKTTEELLRKSEMLSAVGQLAAGIAHEIRNPLTALKGFTKLLGSGVHNESYISIMSSELERIEEIVSELLVLAKPQAVDYLPKDISGLLHDVVMLLETQAIINKVEIVTELDGKLPLVSCVENQLKQVFINILKNAVESMPNGGKIIVRAKRTEDRRIKVSVIDEGCGIPERKIAKLGEPFYTTKNRGTGLGLMVSYKIIENHQGTIYISSQEGVGTNVDIFLPAVI
ncbi:CheR family methyltransferase [Paenibacillus sp. GD4]|uniref:CheR family methyltransferase n=1 Tax=Paenibacillus sp. GD4 TaxID=3068890 RepID=UPI002796580E|nr:CheR family methyltransferase [Paenibacillus sp. GD4]MDQ1913167.1 CheR family methyltransferase [Paenibacillus sp. GD4]